MAKKNEPQEVKAQTLDLTEQERAKYTRMWDVPEYRAGSPGERCYQKFLQHCAPSVGELVTDYGCGPGRASLAIRELGPKVRMVDIASNCLDPHVKDALVPGWLDFVESCLWDLPEGFEPGEWAFCTDVMEHVPEEKVDAVLESIMSHTTKGAFFQIATYEDGHFLKVAGEPLHLTVKEGQWWLNKLSKYGRTMLIDCTGLHITATVMKG